MNKDFKNLPDNLPQPKDDGKADHLLEMMIPDITLSSTIGGIDISKMDTQYVVLYFFPMMASSAENLPIGWNDIPGARGCTPQNIAINEHLKDFEKLGARIYGISTQSIGELEELSLQRKFSQPLISDGDLKFKEKLEIPTFCIEDKTMYKRLTLIVRNSKIIKVFYPIFPPDKHVFEILEWLKK